ncbi:MAG: hypothetical protein ACJ8AT_09485 [Hyalangium sp.]|uniref:hypothetical protein n=1 Tax=Hyalangium sp. TaxID=2028555 RepID=UPI00389AA876
MPSLKIRLCRHASLPLLLLMGWMAPSPVAAQALRRDDVMAKAAQYAEHAWEMRAANQKGTCEGTYKSDHPLGKQTGVPYAWGGSMGLAEFDRRISEGQGAGSHSSDGILSCVAGVDCSGFISQVWQLKQRPSTSSLGSLTQPISLDELRPGDALNKPGKHVVLFAGTTSEGKPIIYEASGSASRVRMATPSWSYLNGYQPVRYPGLEQPAAVASTSPASSTSAAVVPASASASSNASAAVPAVASSSSAPAAASAASSAAAKVSAPGVVRRSLKYGVDVGFQPASVDEQALGPDHLAVGPKGVAALYDRVRGRVLVLARDGAPGSFEAGQVDGLSFTPQGELLVIDSSLHQLRIYRPSGELQHKIDIPRDGPLGAISLENGVIYVTTREGQRRAVAELAGGKLLPPQRGVELSKEQLLALKEHVPGGQLMRLGGESLVVPEKVRISAQPMGKWIELVIAATDSNGHVRVERTLRRPGQVVALPDGARGAYAPVDDLAVATDGTVVYLEPGEKELALAWIDAG